MVNYELMEFEAVVSKLKQHEEIIIQLVEIIASTNRKVHELESNQINGGISTLTDNIH